MYARYTKKGKFYSSKKVTTFLSEGAYCKTFWTNSASIFQNLTVFPRGKWIRYFSGFRNSEYFGYFNGMKTLWFTVSIEFVFVTWIHFYLKKHGWKTIEKQFLLILSQFSTKWAKSWPRMNKMGLKDHENCSFSTSDATEALKLH